VDKESEENKYNKKELKRDDGTFGAIGQIYDLTDRRRSDGI
jgi:hypothetical protein